MTLTGRCLGVARGIEAAGALAPRTAHAVRLAAEAGDQLAGSAAGRAGAGIVLGGDAHWAAEPRSPAGRRTSWARAKTRRASGLPTCPSEAIGASWAAPHGPSAAGAARTPRTRFRRWPAAGRGTGS